MTDHLLSAAFAVLALAVIINTFYRNRRPAEKEWRRRRLLLSTLEPAHRRGLRRERRIFRAEAKRLSGIRRQTTRTY